MPSTFSLLRPGLQRVFVDRAIAILSFVNTCASSSSNCFSSDRINLAERLPRRLMSSRMVYARWDQGEWSCRSDESIVAAIRSGIVDVNAASISNGRNVSTVVHDQYTRVLCKMQMTYPRDLDLGG